VISETYDCVILPGGPGCYSLRVDKALGNFLVRHFQSGKLICVICAAPLVLHDSGILRGKKYTAHPCTYSELTEIAITGNAVADGNLINASGPGTAAKLGFKILEHLVDKATADRIAKATLFKSDFPQKLKNLHGASFPLHFLKISEHRRHLRLFRQKICRKQNSYHFRTRYSLQEDGFPFP
jgi:transcriptional regulator GlxA family with amidase domain